MSETTIIDLAREALPHFEQRTRNDGARFYVVRPVKAPGWVSDLVHEAHAGLLPDDWRFSFTVDSLAAIAECDDPEDAEHASDDFEPDAYTGDMLRWLSSNPQRLG